MLNRFETFTILISKINRCIKKIKSEEVAEFDLKSPHVSCLYYLYKKGDKTAKELCEMCDEDKAALSRTIDFLESNDFITCDSTLKKRYKSPLKLTKKGQIAGKAISEKVDNILDEASLGLNDEERIIMYRSLSIICNNLQTITDKYGG